VAECRSVEEAAPHPGRKAVADLDLEAAAAEEDPAAFQTQDAGVGGLQALVDKEWIAGSYEKERGRGEWVVVGAEALGKV